MRNAFCVPIGIAKPSSRSNPRSVFNRAVRVASQVEVAGEPVDGIRVELD